MADGRITIDTKIDQAGIDKGVQGMQKTLKGTAGKLKKTGKTMSSAITAPIVGLGTVAFAAADQVDKAYRNIQVGTGATGDALDDLKKSFDEVFTDVPDSADAVSNALATINTLTGSTGDTLEDLTKSVLDASRTLGEDGVANSEAFGQAMKQWQIPAEEGTKQLDHLYKLTQDYGIGLGELSGQLTTYGSVLNNAGFSMAESAEFMASLESNGIAVSRVMPGLNKAFRNWAAEGKNSREELAKVVDEIRNTEDSQKALALATEVFGAEGAQRLTTAIRNGAVPAFEELGDSMEESQGLINETTEETKTIGEQFAELKNNVTMSLQPLGEILINLAEQFIPPLIDGVTRLAEWFQNLSPTIQKVIVVIGGIIAVIGPLLVFIGMLINAFTTILPIIKLVGAAIGLLTSPISLTIAAVVALVTIIVIYWEEIWAVTKTVFSAIGDFFVSTWEWIKETFNSAVDGVSNALEKAWNWIKDTTSTIWNGIVSFFSDIWDNIVSRAQNMKDRFLSVWEGIKNGIRTVVNPIIGFINRLISGIENMVNAIARGINRIPSFNIPDWVPGIGGGTFGLPDIPTISLSRIPSLAVGTNFVAKDGLAYLHRGEAVVPKEYNPAAFSRAMDNKQPAVIRLVLGRREFETYVDDITEVQDRKSYRLERFRG